jgi:membrane protein implicated in regulation of membrane protease activity
MFIKSKSQSTRGYTIYALIGSILELVALLIVLLWVLPLFHVYIEWWIIAILLGIELAISLFTYSMGRRALSKRLTFGPEAIIGNEGMVTTPLNPTGYVRVRGELWNACCKSKLEAGDEVVVTGIEGMKLLVVPKMESKSRISGE